mmetsp:Transcript_13435/g.22121  ORF Transcript_13435/g.22121 Transcript_13435/m.22121 type:complete len:407 (+) Transcript_13435:110-1330(+)
MPIRAEEFVDHYELLGCSPQTPFAELKKAYHKKLREFHPDKRQTSLHGIGHQITEKLNDAWAVLSSSDKKEAYDILWHRHQREQSEGKENNQRRRPDANVESKHNREAAKPEGKRHERRWSRQEFSTPREKADQAEQCRREGNESYKSAQNLSNSGDEAAAARLYREAIAKYSMGIELMPEDHKLRSNRALCYGALKEWSHCRDDAYRVTQLNPNFMKGWFMRAKAYWKEGSILIALEVLDSGLKCLPMNEDLLKLKAEIEKERKQECGAKHGGNMPSRNPSPCHSDAPSFRPRMSPQPSARPPRHSSPFRPFVHPDDESAFADIASHFAGRPPPVPPVPRSRPSSPHFDRPPRPSSTPPVYSVPEGMPRPESWRHRSGSQTPSLHRRGSLGSMAGAPRRQVDAAF